MSEQGTKKSNVRGEWARRRALLESTERVAGMGSWEWIPEMDELSWSENLFRIFGVGPGEVAPSLELVFERAHPDDREEVIRAAEQLRLGGDGHPLEYRIVLPDGSVHH